MDKQFLGNSKNRNAGPAGGRITMGKTRYTAMCAAVTAGLVLAAWGSTALAAADAGAAKEADLIKIIQSDAPPQDKAIPCKQLAIYGTAKAVPALASLLTDADLASWARIALEAIPDQAADEALRQALGKLKGRLLIGVVNSIGVKEYAKATDDLTPLLKGADQEVASAAAAALGRIGTAKAAAALQPLLGVESEALRSAGAEGCVRCAEKFLAAGQADEAITLYDTVRKANVPRQRVIEATRGAILARKSGGVGMLVELLRSRNRAMYGLGLRVAREMACPEATDALVAELKSASADRQAGLLLALASRGDSKSLPAVIDVVKTGQGMARVTAIELLQKMGDVSCVSALLGAAVDDDAAVAKAAKLTLARLSGPAVSQDIVARLGKSDGKVRLVLVELAGLRQLPEALPVIVKLAGESDQATRAAALAAISIMGTGKQIPGLVTLVSGAKSADERAGFEKSLTALCGRAGASCVGELSPLAKSQTPELRLVGLHAMIAAGGADALAAVKAAIEDKDETVQDEAIRTLSTWPNKWPADDAVAEPLLAIAKSATKVSHKVLAIRGYLQYLQASKKLSAAERLTKVKQVLPLASRPEEKKLAIAVLATINSTASLEALTAMTAEPAVAQEACLAIVQLAAGRGDKALDKSARKKALEAVLAKSRSDRAKKTARAALKGL